MVVEKRRSRGAVMIYDEILRLRVDYLMVAKVLPPVEGEEQGQVLE